MATLKIDKERSYKATDIQLSNLIIEGENSEVMAALFNEPYSLEAKIDCMIWDPPYNTGRKDFIYNDKMSHADWLSFMEVRLELAKKLLKESGIIAIHIGYQELFRLGLLMDEVFGEDNRLAIINWECAYSPKNNNKGIPSTTDYVLIYAKNKERAFRGVIPRTEAMDSRYKNPDGDKRIWASDNLSSMKNPESYRYGIENPFTSELHYPPENSYWRIPKGSVNELLCAWGIKYVINSDGNCVVKKGENRERACALFKKGPWPKIYFLGKNGEGRPRLKRYKDELKNEGRILGTYWQADDILDETWKSDDYILIYAKNKKSMYHGVMPRTAEMNSRYSSPDGDKDLWKSTPLLATSGNESYRYGIQNPFTGEIHYPKTAYWRRSKQNIKTMLEEWGIKYREDKKGNLVTDGKYDVNDLLKRLSAPWPVLNFGKSGNGVPRLKSYLKDVEAKGKGRGLGTYWQADEILDETWQSDEQLNLSLSHEISGHNDGAKKLIKSILGDACVFNTPKPLKLTERLIEMFCPKEGIVLDAFGGSATTAHAVLDLNKQGANRQFVIIERGSANFGFADSITAERVRRVIEGNWVYPKPDTKPLDGSFVYLKLMEDARKNM